jgi:hypothetical protein
MLKPDVASIPTGATPEERTRLASLYFADLLHAQTRTRRMKVRTNGQ